MLNEVPPPPPPPPLLPPPPQPTTAETVTAKTISATRPRQLRRRAGMPKKRTQARAAPPPTSDHGVRGYSTAASPLPATVRVAVAPARPVLGSTVPTTATADPSVFVPEKKVTVPDGFTPRLSVTTVAERV